MIGFPSQGGSLAVDDRTSNGFKRGCLPIACVIAFVPDEASTWGRLRSEANGCYACISGRDEIGPHLHHFRLSPIKQGWCN